MKVRIHLIIEPTFLIFQPSLFQLRYVDRLKKFHYTFEQSTSISKIDLYKLDLVNLFEVVYGPLGFLQLRDYKFFQTQFPQFFLSQSFLTVSDIIRKNFDK